MRAKRIDKNQPEIVKLLRQVPGMSVAVTSSLGSGFPDLVISFRKKTVLCELKDPSQPPSKRKLTPDEKDFHDAWTGEIYVVESADEVLKIFGLI